MANPRCALCDTALAFGDEVVDVRIVTRAQPDHVATDRTGQLAHLECAAQTPNQPNRSA